MCCKILIVMLSVRSGLVDMGVMLKRSEYV